MKLTLAALFLLLLPMFKLYLLELVVSNISVLIALSFLTLLFAHYAIWSVAHSHSFLTPHKGHGKTSLALRWT